MPKLTGTEMPGYIAADTYTGTYSRGQGKFRADTFTAAELAEMLGGEGEPFVVWVSFGHVNGQERFGRDRFIADAEGNLHLYSSDGHRVLVHGAERPLRILTKPA